MATTRAEHMAWCKERALAELDRGDAKGAITSMMSDLGKHPETAGHVGITLGIGMMMIPGWLNKEGEVRRWIEGFN